LRTIGSGGSGAGQFNQPRGVAFDSAGHIIVADKDNDRVQVLRYSDGSHVRTIGSKGRENGQFCGPYGVLIDSQGRIIVSDYAHHRTQVLQ
jgi:DNA-binding beta-propeller fold protein YncE